jgi:hypothetical protein
LYLEGRREEKEEQDDEAKPAVNRENLEKQKGR